MAGKSSTVIMGFVERGSIQASSLNIQCLRACVGPSVVVSPQNGINGPSRDSLE
jgi:hypothetical protein